MRRALPWAHWRVLALAAPLLLAACGSLIGLGELDKSECVVDCGASPGGGSSSSGSASASASAGAGAGVTAGAGGGGGGGATAGIGALNGGSGGVANAGSGGTTTNIAGSDSAGAGGDVPGVEMCPGGPVPAATWKEHWLGHGEALTRVYYDDCIALYFDADTNPATKDWLIPFLDKAWAYSLATYGKLGPERIYVVVHEGKHEGGHSSTFVEASHDNHAVIDMGQDGWADGDYDLPAHLLGFLVDSEGAHTKFGAPKSSDYENVGFPLIYKYDLYRALGLTSVAASALTEFNAIKNAQPSADTYWFKDWFYPVWRDHGHAQVFANYQTLLQKHFTVGADLWMPDMNYGQYFHFMSGAAGVDLVPLARTAFHWTSQFDDELTAAKVDFPDIKY